MIFVLENCTDSSNNTIKLEPTQNEKLNLGKLSQIIKLENLKESNFGSISKTEIDFNSKKIFVLADFNIFIFDTSGKYIKKLKRGKGPGEISDIIGFTTDKNNKLIYAIDRSDRICVIDYNGSIIKDYQLLNFYCMDIMLIDDNNVLLLDNFVTEKDSFFVVKYNLSENIITQRFVPVENSPYPILVRLMNNNFTSTGKRHFFACSNIFGLFEYKENQFHRIINFDLGKRSVPNHFSKNFLKGYNRTIFMDEALNRNYVPFLLYSFYFKNHYFAIIQDKINSCYVINENNMQKIYQNGILAAYFNLPNIKSLRFPEEINEEYLVFSCNPLDFFETSPVERTKQVIIGEYKLEIEYDSNPFLLIVE